MCETNGHIFGCGLVGQLVTYTDISVGCGVYDGSEVHEAAATLAALTRLGKEPVMYAPDSNQAHVVDHATGEEVSKL